ncbi:MAG TPA: XrtB/PEP-CTERM-associated polysaccharide biosynthesis outer membrane protein EpsL [Methylophilaceae bacterium]|jgi:exopolysaccharide biosynthesis operon protein EpsL
MIKITRFVSTWLFAMVLAIPVKSMADADDTLNFVAGGGIRFEDNLFRLSDSVDASSFPGKPSKSDLIYSANAGIKIDKPYAQQRFQLDLVATQNKYQNNSFLDFTGLDYRAAWLWHLTPHISGTVLAEQDQQLVNFADFRAFNDSNVQTNQVRVFNIDGEVGSGLHLIGGLLDVRSRNSQNFTAVGNYVQRGGEYGIKYIAPSDSWISLVQRETQGEYRGRILDPVAQLDTGFEESETEAKLNWKLTGKSTIDARLSYLDRSHDHFSQRDYSGMTGKVEYQWAATGKLQFNASLARNLYSFQEATNSYYVADTLSIGPVWKITAKTTLRARYDYSDRDYRGAIVPVASLRQDTVHSFIMGADWQATRTILVSGILQRDIRASNFNNLDYSANAIGISAQLLF